MTVVATRSLIVKTEDAILDIAQRIAASFHPAKGILFGSRARGTARADSDVDVLVLVDQTEGLSELTGQMYRVIAGVGVPVDLVVMSVSEFEQVKPYIGTVARPASREG